MQQLGREAYVVDHRDAHSSLRMAASTNKLSCTYSATENFSNRASSELGLTAISNAQPLEPLTLITC
jgi:hypothetical protein